MTIETLDVIRWFILGQAGLVIAATFFIWVRYALTVIKDPRQPMLWHIVTISSSYNLAVVFIAMATIERFGQPITWRLPVAAFVFILGDAGLCFMLTHLYSHRVYAKHARDRLIREEIAASEGELKQN